MSVKGIGFTYKMFNFPCGEMHVQITEVFDCKLKGVQFDFEKNEDIIELLLVADAMKRMNLSCDMLQMPYIPFSRQDRVNVEGECFSLKVFADLINSLGFRWVYVYDPHSDVSTALINNCRVSHQEILFVGYLNKMKNFYLVSPDGGALKKIYKLASMVDCLGVIECSKNRNVKTGEITGVNVHSPVALTNETVVLVDDICDGGRTFIEIAKAFKKNPEFTGKIILCVSHGFFTRGLEVFDGLIDEIYTHEKRVK